METCLLGSGEVKGWGWAGQACFTSTLTHLVGFGRAVAPSGSSQPCRCPGCRFGERMQSHVPPGWRRAGVSPLTPGWAMRVKAPTAGYRSWDRACVVCGCINELCVASALSPAEIRWAFLRTVTSKSLLSSCAIALQGSISVSGIKGDQTSSGCFFFFFIYYYFLFLMPTFC